MYSNVKRIGIITLMLLMLMSFVSAQLVDVTNYNSDNTCVTTQNNFHIETENCNVNGYGRYTHYLNFEWQGQNSILTDWYFRTDNALSDFKVVLLQDNLIDYGNGTIENNPIESDITHKFGYVGDDLYLTGKYFELSDINFNSEQNYRIAFTFSSTDKSGKYDIFGKLDTDTLTESINNNRYIFQDPTFQEYLQNVTNAFYLMNGTQNLTLTNGDSCLDDPNLCNRRANNTFNLTAGNSPLINSDGYFETNGVNNYFDSDILSLSSEYTILTWIKKGAEGSQETIFGSQDTGTNTIFDFRFEGDDSIGIYARADGGSGAINPNSNTVVLDGNWNLIAVTYESNRFNFYLNDTNIGNISNTMPNINPDDTFCIGVKCSTTNQQHNNFQFQGFMVVNESFTLANITEVYNNGKDFNYFDDAVVVASVLRNATFTQSPVNITDEVDDINVSVYLNATGLINASTVKIWGKHEDLNGYDNCFKLINGTCTQNNSEYYELLDNKTVYNNNASYNWTLDGRDYALPLVANIQTNLSPVGNYSVYNNQYLVTRMLGVDNTNSYNGHLEIRAFNSSNTVNDLEIYMCNDNTLITGNCVLLGTVEPGEEPDHQHPTFNHYEVTYRVTDGVVEGEYNITDSEVYILIASTTSISRPWLVQYFNINCGADHIQTTLQNTCQDIHIHEIHNLDVFSYKVNGTFIDGNTFETFDVNNTLIEGNTPPPPVNITSPTSATYENTFTLDHSIVTDPQGDVVTYNAFLIGQDFVQEINTGYSSLFIPNIVQFTQYDGFTNGTYRVAVQSCDPLSCNTIISESILLQETTSVEGVTVSVDVDIELLVLGLVFLVVLVMFVVAQWHHNEMATVVLGVLLSVVSVVCMTITFNNDYFIYLFVIPLIYGLTPAFLWLSK